MIYLIILLGITNCKNEIQDNIKEPSTFTSTQDVLSNSQNETKNNVKKIFIFERLKSFLRKQRDNIKDTLVDLLLDLMFDKLLKKYMKMKKEIN
jgi:hypothetical protein